jgi:hypothetical protein
LGKRLSPCPSQSPIDGKCSKNVIFDIIFDFNCMFSPFEMPDSSFLRKYQKTPLSQKKHVMKTLYAKKAFL